MRLDSISLLDVWSTHRLNLTQIGLRTIDAIDAIDFGAIIRRRYGGN